MYTLIERGIQVKGRRYAIEVVQKTSLNESITTEEVIL
jgi:hypothetical protein